MPAAERAKALNVCTDEHGASTRVNTESIRVDKPLLFVLVFVVAGVAIAHRALDAHFDFGMFYYAAHMVLRGARHSLYDPATQHAFQVQLHRPAQLLFCYPPFVLLPFFVIGWLPIEVAFIVWTVVSLALLVLSVRRLTREAGLRYRNWPLLLSLAFMPVASSLGHGQLSLVILFAYVLTYSLWRQGRLFLGGLALALVTFKFQLVIGFVAVLLVKRKWRELLGFATGSAVFLAVSVLITGVPALLRYPAFLLQGGGDVGSELNKMACWRGLLSLVSADHWIPVAALSILTILFAARSWRDLDTGFSAAILAAMLVSYHFGPQDLSLFLIPAFLSVKIGFPKERLLPLALSALLLPEILAIFGGYYALLAIPLALCLWWIGSQQRSNSPTELAAAAAVQ